MKPVSLEFCGINSFSEKAEIDFRTLLEFGIFGIFGDTGSGKSTILDCICFALYGDVTRLNSRTAGLSDFINYKCDKAYVHFTFELSHDGKRKTYRVEREIKRKGSSSHNVKVYECGADGALTAVAEGVRDGKLFLENLIGLEQSDFEKCIALPQGEFAQFVKATPSERLRIVSRLFNLERYGIALSRRANEKYAAAKKAADIAEAKLAFYAEVSAEKNAELKTEISRLEKENEKYKAELSGLREEERKLAEAVKKIQEAERLTKRSEELSAERAETELLEGELSRLDGASAVVAAEKERAAAQQATERARGVYVAARERAESAAGELEAAKKWNAEQADAEISRLTELRARAQSAQGTAERRKKLEARLVAARMEFAAENELFRGYSYEKEREAIEKRLLSLGEGDFTAFTEEHGKAALLRKEYQTFTEELKALTKKHEQIRQDTEPLIAKYAALSEGDKTDFAEIIAAFEAREKQKSVEQQNLIDLEKYNARYKLHCERLQQLQTEGSRAKEELEALQKSAGENIPPLAEVEKMLSERKREKAKRQEELERAREKSARANEELAAATERGSNLAAMQKGAQERLQNALKAGKFNETSEAEALIKKFGDPAARARVKAYAEEVAAVSARLADLKKEKLPKVSEHDAEVLRERLKERETQFSEINGALALKRDELSRGEKQLGEKKALETEFSAAAKSANLYERLKKLLDGNKLMEFMAEEHLQTVAVNATQRLLSLTDGRYFLRYEKGFFVGDNFNGGALRGVYTLSGGETFLVSLSLALALSQEICARSLRPIEFFFLDEGFGTLDERLVDTVMNSLEKLKGEHFSIGIISHVEELKHRIDRKLLVRKATERRGSQIETV